MAELLAGYFGEPADFVIPGFSFRRIVNAVFDSDETHTDIVRDVSFRAICDPQGVNVSEVVVTTHELDGRQIDREVRLVYRGGRYKSGTVTIDGAVTKVHRLSDGLRHILLSDGG